MPKKTGQRKIEPASSEEALAFIRKMQKAFPRTPRTAQAKASVHKYLAKFTDDELKSVGSRVLSDLLLRPPVTIEPGDYPVRRKAGKAVARSAAPPPKPRKTTKRAVKSRARARKRA